MRYLLLCSFLKLSLLGFGKDNQADSVLYEGWGPGVILHDRFFVLVVGDKAIINQFSERHSVISKVLTDTLLLKENSVFQGKFFNIMGNGKKLHIKSNSSPKKTFTVKLKNCLKPALQTLWYYENRVLFDRMVFNSQSLVEQKKLAGKLCSEPNVFLAEVERLKKINNIE